MIKAIIVDCDQVLTANTKQQLCRELAVKYEKDYDALYKLMRTLWKQYKMQEISEDQFMEEMITQGGLEGLPVNDLKEMRKLFQVLHPEIKQWLQAQHANKLLFIASNYGKEWSQHLRKEYGLDDLFTGYFWSWELKEEKPSKAFFDKVVEGLAKHDIQPNEALFIDDYDKNTEAAQAAGLQVITFNDIEHLEQAYQNILVHTS